MKKQVTILDVAKECGISKSAVAYALNGEAKGKVSAKKLKEILSVSKRFGYRPNMTAKALSSNKTRTIGIMLPHPTNYYFSALCIALQKKIWAEDYTAIFAFWENFSDAAAINKTYEMLMSRNVDGIITCNLQGVNFSNEEKPTIVYEDEVDNLDCVIIDQSVNRKAIEHLVSKGHEKIAFIAPEINIPRVQGFLNAFKDFNLKINPDWLLIGASREAGRAAMQKLLSMKEKPTAIIGSNDILAIGAMNEALRNGVKVPGEMAFIGYDDIEEASYTYPSLTSFKTSPDVLADSLTKLLFRRIGEPEAEIKHELIIPEFIIRESV